MIEFDAAALIATEARFLLGSSSLPEYAATLDGGGALLSKGSDGGPVLMEDFGGSGDEWIASMLSSASPDAVAAGIILAGDDDLIDRSSAEGEGEEIIITGKRLHETSFDGEIGGGSGTAGGNTGGGGAGTGAIGVAPHPQDCVTDDGAAVQVARHVQGLLPDGVAGPENPVTTSSGNSWRTVEFCALIVQNPDGTFGAFSDMIYSSDQSSYVLVPYNAVQPIQGLWHSHPEGQSGRIDVLKQRYPSASDWNSLSQIAGRLTAVSDPSLWITDGLGVTREFKLSERNYFEKLADNESDLVDGKGLDGRERTQSCG